MPRNRDQHRTYGRGHGQNYEDDYDEYQSRSHQYDDDYDYEDDDRSYRSSSRGRQGFASMSPEERRRIAAKGGRASHGGRGRSSYRDDDYAYANDYYNKGDDYNYDNNRSSSRSSRGRQGFASMDPEKQRRIAAMGGRASHGGHRRQRD